MADTEQALRKLLNKIAVEQGYRDHEIVITEIFSGGANYTSKLFTADIKGLNKDDLHLFAKVAVLGEKFRTDAPTKIFETESFFYTKLCKKFEALEEENGLPEKERVSFTKFFGYDPSLYRELLVLENLEAEGFESYNRFKSIGWEYASAAIRELAKFHALSLAYWHKYPEEFETDLAYIKTEAKSNGMDEFARGASANALKNVNVANKEALERFFKKYGFDLITQLTANITRPVIMHGDYRGSNLMHRRRKYVSTRAMAHTEKSLRVLLDKIAEEHKYHNCEVIVNETYSGGANYTSKLYTVILRAPNKEDLHLFAKVAAVGKQFRDELPSTAAFVTERFVYTKLWKIYQSLEEENGIPEELRLVYTKCYGYDPTLYQETVVLEDLLAQGYGPFDRFKPLEWEYASAAILQLAKLHALSFAYSEKYPEEFNKVVADVEMKWKEGSMDAMTSSFTVTALNTVKSEYKEALEKFIDKYMNDLWVRFYRPIHRTVLVHSDYRGSNLLHRAREDGKMDIKIVDLQTLQGGSPVTDLLYFIFTGSDEQFRAQFYDKLIDHYYTELSAAMKRFHLNPDEIYSRADFDRELKEKLPFGLTLAVFTLPVITVDSENAPKVDEGLELSNFNVEKTSDLYAERLNGVINDYVKWGILK